MQQLAERRIVNRHIWLIIDDDMHILIAQQQLLQVQVPIVRLWLARRLRGSSEYALLSARRAAARRLCRRGGLLGARRVAATEEGKQT